MAYIRKDNSERTIFSQNLVWFRVFKKNISQEEFGKLIGMSRGAYSSYEESRANPPIKTVFKIADLMGVMVDDLFKKDLSKQQPKEETEPKIDAENGLVEIRLIVTPCEAEILKTLSHQLINYEYIK